MTKLTHSEEIVMLAVWECEGVVNLPNVAEIVNGKYNQNWAMQTISTFLSRLRDKKYVELIRNGRIYTYNIFITKEAYRKHMTQNLCEALYDGDRQKMIDDIK